MAQHDSDRVKKAAEPVSRRRQEGSGPHGQQCTEGVGSFLLGGVLAKGKLIGLVMCERRNRLKSKQQAERTKFFVVGATARTCGEPTGENCNTAATYFMRLGA